MSQATALAAAQQLRTALLDHGVRRVSIELQAGRGPAGDPWHARTFRRPMSHHIVSRRSSGLTPGLALVKRGRSDLPGPLCNGYGGFDLTYRIICMGWANHPGAGGPTTLAGLTVPRNNGRPYFFGTEYEGGLSLADWTDDFREFMGRANAGISAWLGSPADGHAEHATWTSRKVDRLGYTTASGRAELRHYLGAPRPAPSPAPTPVPAPTGELIMDADAKEAFAALTKEVQRVANNIQGNVTETRKQATSGFKAAAANNAMLVQLLRELGQRPDVNVDVDEAELAQAIAQAIPDDLAAQVVDELHRRTAPKGA